MTGLADGSPESETPDEDAEYEEWARTLDELDSRAVKAEEAGDPREAAAAYVALAEHIAGEVDVSDVIDVLLAAREAYQQFDPARATEMVQVVGGLASSSGDNETARTAFGIACDELAESGDDEAFAGALNDLGAMCMQLGEFDDADYVLSASIDLYLQHGMVDDAAEVRLNLANNHRSSGRREDAEREFLELTTYFGGDTVKGAICRESLAGLYTESGRPYLARDEFEKAIAVYEQHGEEVHVAMARAGLATVLIGIGQDRRGDELLTTASAWFAEHQQPDKVAVCEYNRASAAIARRDYQAADVAFDAAAKGLAEAGMHHQLANLQWNRVKRLTMEAAGDPLRAPTLGAEAVDIAIASLIAGDYERFQFADSWRRGQWRATLEHRITWTFLMAYSLGSAQLTADLIESVLNAGVYGLTSAPESDDPVALDLTVERGPLPPADEDTSELATTLGMAATLLATAELPMTPPPALVDGTGRVLLQRQRDIAAALDPDLARTLEAVPRVAVW